MLSFLKKINFAYTFHLAWFSLLFYCGLNNFNNFVLDENSTGGISGYPGESIVSLMTGTFFILAAISFPVGTVLKFREKPLAFWIGNILLASLLAALSDAFGVPEPYMDEAFCDEPVKRFFCDWGAWISAMVIFYTIPLGICYGMICNQRKRKGIVFQHKNRWRIISGILLIIIFALIVVGWRLSQVLCW